MDTKKAEELQKLTSDFVKKFKELTDGDEKTGLVVAMRANDGKAIHGVVSAVGTMATCLLAMHDLDTNTDMVKNYAMINASIELEHMMKGLMGGERKDEEQPSGEEQGE